MPSLGRGPATGFGRVQGKVGGATESRPVCPCSSYLPFRHAELHEGRCESVRVEHSGVVNIQTTLIPPWAAQGRLAVRCRLAGSACRPGLVQKRS